MPSTLNIVKAALYPLLYLLLCAAIAAVAAYPLFTLTGGDGGRYFRSMVSRGAQVFLILGLFRIARRFGFTWKSLGFSRAFPRQWTIGFALGGLMLGLHVCGLLALDIRAVNGDLLAAGGVLPGVLGKALATGVIVALLEEILLRGVLFAYVRDLAGPLAAVLISAFYYASLHFLRSDWRPELADIGWDTGFRVVSAGFANLAAVTPDAFLALFVAGVLLASVRAVCPAGLGYCMGLHAGWVFIIKTTKPLTHVQPDARWSFLVSDYDRVIGYLSSAWLAALLLVLYAAARRWGRG